MTNYYQALKVALEKHACHACSGTEKLVNYKDGKKFYILISCYSCQGSGFENTETIDGLISHLVIIDKLMRLYYEVLITQTNTAPSHNR